MRRHILVAAFAAAAAPTASAPAGAAPPGAAARATQQVPGARLWVARYNSGANSEGFAYSMAGAMAVSPDGSRVFVTGKSEGRTTGYDYATVAYSAATGGQLWVSRYYGPGNGLGAAASVAVSPAGTTAYVTGYSAGGTGIVQVAMAARSCVWAVRVSRPGPVWPGGRRGR
jgi:DNA-binding beta-propeller fold protein YncE